VFGGSPAALSNQTTVLEKGDKAPPFGFQTDMLVPRAIRDEWGDFVWWDRSRNVPRAITRDQVGARRRRRPAARGTVEVTLLDGKKVACRPVFDLVKEYAAHFDPKTTRS